MRRLFKRAFEAMRRAGEKPLPWSADAHVFVVTLVSVLAAIALIIFVPEYQP
ncbi:hypothetical protein [Hoeflea sp.]|uniref:hypothetical protein n=1 Tax=Hoeflea sp. TaxID=1940281 RepID=UPI003BB0A22C